MTTESWAPVSVPGYESLYEVSDAGRVRSLDRTVVTEYERGPVTRTFRGVVLKGTADGGGYTVYSLRRGGRSGPRSFVRGGVLVLGAFVGRRPDDHVVRHLDGDPSNDALSNLAWGTQQENVDDAMRHGTGNKKLDDRQIDEVRRRALLGEDTLILAEEFSISRSYVYRIKNRTYTR